MNATLVELKVEYRVESFFSRQITATWKKDRSPAIFLRHNIATVSSRHFSTTPHSSSRKHNSKQKAKLSKQP
jgi:hypothetical protein